MKQIRASAAPDAGYTMLPALGIGLLVMLLVGVTVHQGDFTLKLTRRTQDVNAARQAADGAVQDYISRINSDPTYLRFAHVPATNCPSGPATATIDTANPLMGPDVVPLPGAGAADVRARYVVDASAFCTQGVMVVTAYGRSGKVERKMRYTVKQRHFADYAYFSELETLNPAKYPATHPWVVNGELDWRCERHHQDPSKRHPTTGQVLAPTREWDGSDKCAMVNWVTGDYVQGDLHTNDALLACGYPVFDGKATTSWQGDGTRRYLANPGCTTNPNFPTNYENQYCPQNVDDACYDAPLALPLSVTALKTNPLACIYTGPTKVVMTQNSMTVVSPNTPARASTDPCRTGTGVPINVNGLYFVQDVPPGAASVPCTTPTNVLSPQNPVGYPIEFDITTYECTTGDLFIEGNTRKPVTFASERKTVITHIVNYMDDSAVTADPRGLVGLIAGTDIEIYHPVNSAGNNLTTPPEPDKWYIEAVLLAVNGSVLAQNYDKGERFGALRIQGGLAQRWRGLVGTTDRAHGFRKNYFYDPDLRERLPPHFLPSPGSPWRVAIAVPVP